jgi:hypothetical protein
MAIPRRDAIYGPFVKMVSWGDRLMATDDCEYWDAGEMFSVLYVAGRTGFSPILGIVTVGGRKFALDDLADEHGRICGFDLFLQMMPPADFSELPPFNDPKWRPLPYAYQSDPFPSEPMSATLIKELLKKQHAKLK